MDIRPLSFSQINLYLSCPFAYKLQYIERLKPKDKWYFSFGSTIHSCAEHFFRVKVPPPPALEELLRFYDENWLSAGYESEEEEANYKAYGREILTAFWEIHYRDFQMPLAVEKLFYIDVDSVKLRGFIDRIDKLETGGLSIVDYKTSRELFTYDYLKNDLQLTLYQLAAEQLWQMPVEKLTLYHMRSNTPVICPGRMPLQLNEAKELVLDVAEKINQGIFPATEHDFCPCDFPEHCPYHRHLYSGETTEVTAGEPSPVTIEAEDIERYASLQAQIKELQRELDELRQGIISYCEVEGLNRVYGPESEITYQLVEITGFKEEDVKSLLEPEGLWEKVLGFDQSRLKGLLDDESVARQLKDRIQSLREVISTQHRLLVRRRQNEDKNT
jgi:RecB family exonuclease